MQPASEKLSKSFVTPRGSGVVVVVSAMSGVTNRLVEAAKQSEAGNREAVAAIFEELRERHHAVVNALIHSVGVRSRIGRGLRLVFEEGERLCQVRCSCKS